MIQVATTTKDTALPWPAKKAEPTLPQKQVISHGAYRIEVTPSKEFPFEKDPLLFDLSHIIGWVFWACYLLAYFIFIRGLESASVVQRACLWTALGAECCLAFVDFNWALDAIIPMFRTKKHGRRPHYRLLGDAVPHVDIFVTCCGESLDILLNTIKAAAAQDYPVTKFNVVVLDDGHDENLRYTIDHLNRIDGGFAKVYYRSRKVEPDTRSYFKAGNLNFGITETKKLTNGDFLASLDADMIVSPNWLRQLIPHLLLDPKLAMTTSPQNYYNVPYGDPLAQQAEFSIWNTIFEPIHDKLGEAMCMGTGFVVRRAALEDIGGWPLAETGEDYMCSTKLVEAGWKVAFVRENHQHGITPESYVSRVKQRLRWVDAAVEVHKNNNWYLTNNFGEGVTLVDKASSLLFALRDLSALSTTLSLLVLPFAVIILAASGTVVLPEASSLLLSGNWFNTLNVLLVLAFISSKVCEWNIYHHAGMSLYSNLQSLDIWCAPYCASRILSHIFSLAPTKTATFFVTGTFVCPTNERTPSKRAPFYTRLMTFGLPLHTSYVLFSTTVIYFGLQSLARPLYTISPTAPTVPALLPGHLLLLARCTWKVGVPVWYMAFPPDVLQWHHFLEEDQGDGKEKGTSVLRPKREKRFPGFVRGDQKGGVEVGWAREVRDAGEALVLGLGLLAVWGN